MIIESIGIGTLSSRFLWPALAFLCVVGTVVPALAAERTASIRTVSPTPTVSDPSAQHVVWISVLGMVPQVNSSGQTNLALLRGASGNTLRVTTAQAGDLQWIHQPLALPTNLGIQAIITCYRLSSAASYISQVRISEETVPPSATVRYDNPTDLLSTTPVCAESPVASLRPNGAMTLSYRLNFASTTDWVDFGAIGVVLAP
jgi:hypothetical protein